MATNTKDARWLRHAFLLPISDRQTEFGAGSRRRYATSAAYKFENTKLGGNWAINNPPQFTRYADIRVPGKGRTEDQWTEGMGRYYSEAIDDTRQIVHMSFGVPNYSSWASFFTNFYDRNTALLANTGRSSGAFYNLGLVGGYIVTLPLQPFIIGISAVTRVYNFLAKQQPSKWYYFKPTMHSYWSAVNTIANDMAINMGLIPRVYGESDGDLREGTGISDADILMIHQMMPGIWREDGGIDVMVLARKTQMMSDKAQQAARRLKETSTNLTQVADAMVQYAETEEDPTPNFENAKKYFEAYVALNEGKDDGDFGSESFAKWKDLKGIYDFTKASQRDGSQFASFRVQYNGSVSESFSNSTRESGVAQTLNQKVSQGREASFNLMGGDITESVGAIADAVKSFTAGLLDTVNLGGLATLAGTAYLDIPKLWDNSTANLPRADYTIPLPNAYGNPLSRYMNLMIPISMMLAAALPLSAGRAAYTSPFLCQIYHQGRCQIQLGMIDSLTITRGTGNVGWSAEHDMLGAEISFSVVDMSSIMHAPIKGGFTQTGNWVETAFTAGVTAAAEGIGGDTAAGTAAALTNPAVWNEQNAFSDYMSVLSSMSLENNYYVGRRLNLNVTRSLRAFKTWRSPSNFMSFMLDGQPARVLSGLAQYSSRF